MIDWRTAVWTQYGIEPTADAIAAYCVASGTGTVEGTRIAVPPTGTPPAGTPVT